MLTSAGNTVALFAVTGDMACVGVVWFAAAGDRLAVMFAAAVGVVAGGDAVEF